MREILFRGKRADNYNDVEGFFAVYKCRAYIIEMTNGLAVNWHDVIPETVGQYTGLKDKNGKRIFEADLVMFRSYTEPCEIAWDQEEARWFMKFSDCYIYFDDRCIPKDFEVIGNIHDNPELIAEVEGC